MGILLFDTCGPLWLRLKERVSLFWLGCETCEDIFVFQWRGQNWNRRKKRLGKQSGSELHLPTAAGSWRRCSRMKRPGAALCRTLWTQTAPASQRQSRGAHLPPARPTAIWMVCWLKLVRTRTAVNLMTCFCTPVPRERCSSATNGSISAARMGPYEEWGTKWAQAKCFSTTSPTCTLYVAQHFTSLSVWLCFYLGGKTCFFPCGHLRFEYYQEPRISVLEPD